jgi:hypothetical protein
VKIKYVIILFYLCTIPLIALETKEDEERIYRFEPSEYDDPWIKVDMNGDGKVDHVLLIDDVGDRIEEAMDFNKDGLMDVFYYYHKGALKFQHIDSNYDQKIDVWITLKEGIYIQKYIIDTDFDGKPDIEKDYDEDE